MASRGVRIAVAVGLLVAEVALAVFIAFKASPWPSALLIRWKFDRGADAALKALEKHVPEGVAVRRDERYDPTDPDAYLDVFYPASVERSGEALPTVVWAHGGGWVSGKKEDVANYARILAARGYTVVSVDYSIAPKRTYPTPVRQVNTALAYVSANASRLHVDPARIVLAGDSGGAHIVAQVANAIGDSSYARVLGLESAIDRSRLRGALLYCGAYDTRRLNLDGPFGGFLRTVLWSYSGGKDFQTNPRFATASVVDYVGVGFPPAFVSAGNGDPLLGQSRAFAAALAARGVAVDSLFFPSDHAPALPHEYQFDLDGAPGRMALERSVAFLARVTAGGE